ncbi:hypothetical protein PMIN03_007351 [Paraphaeosphaeria minitans]
MPRGVKVALGEISAPESRVLRVTNIHWDARNADIARFFGGYGLVDCKRYINVKIGKSTVAYVLLSTLEDVVRAIEELHLKELLGRQVRIMRAVGGFQLAPSDFFSFLEPHNVVSYNKHLESPALENTPFVKPESQVMPLPPLTGTLQLQTFRGTSYNMLGRSRIPPPALLDSNEHRPTNMFPSRRRRLQSRPQGPEHRVLFISKLHPDANRNAIELFLEGFHIVDYKRKYNDRTGKYNNTAFVLFESVEERDRARNTKNEQKILDMEVSLDVAMHHIHVSNNGFLPDNISEIASMPRTPLANEPDRIGSGFPSASASNLINDSNLETNRSTYGSPKWAQAHTNTNHVEQNNLPMNAARHFIPETGPSSYDGSPQYQPGVAYRHSISVHDTPSEVHHVPTNIQRTPLRDPGPWNLAGNDSNGRQYNIVTEKE